MNGYKGLFKAITFFTNDSNTCFSGSENSQHMFDNIKIIKRHPKGTSR